MAIHIAACLDGSTVHETLPAERMPRPTICSSPCAKPQCYAWNRNSKTTVAPAWLPTYAMVLTKYSLDEIRLSLLPLELLKKDHSDEIWTHRQRLHDI
jgi:hypothetical protein